MRRLIRTLHSERGITLVETLIAIGIMTVMLTVIGLPIVHALRYDEDWRQGIISVVALQQADRWVSKDAPNAQTVSVADGAAPVDTLTLDWEDIFGTPHTAVYSLTGTTFVRTLDGSGTVVARNVQSVAFSRASNLLTFTISVQAASGTTDSKTGTYYLRSLE